jgi:hypothetical protein
LIYIQIFHFHIITPQLDSNENYFSHRFQFTKMAPRLNQMTPSAVSIVSSQSTDASDAQVEDREAHRTRRLARQNSQRQAPNMHPQFRNKPVCELICKHCDTLVCHRGMQAILLGDVRVQLFSTDVAILGRYVFTYLCP